MTQLKPFNQIMSELLEASGLTREQLSEKLSGMPDCPTGKEQGKAPSLNLIKSMAKVLKPNIQQEMELFRSVAIIMAVDKERTFSEIFCAYRKGFGLSLENIGTKLESIQGNNEDEIDFNLLAALYETGAKLPNSNEIKALVKIFGFDNSTEIANFTAKVSTTNQSAIQVVDKNFHDDTKLTKEKIKEAEKLLKEDTKQKTGFIVSEAAKLLLSKKQNPQ